MSNILVQFTQPPYSGSDAEDGLDFVLAATNYGHDVAVLFTGDGVYQLHVEQTPSFAKNHAKRLKMMPLYDIEDVYISKPCLESRHLSSDNLVNVDGVTLSHQQVTDLINQAKHVVTF